MVPYHPPKHFEKKIPAGDDRTRLVCNQCEWVHYENPKIIVGLVPIYKGKILLCNRAIEPRQGYWTIPAGFMELKETAEKGAKREAWEEARVQVEINALLGVYSIP
ncbi:MAG TPA: NUDIX hydrolase, partial [Planctomycetaceae bacterium]|nr:NUDIX hydrolase [Planctomycetaceae bacterium]